MRNIYFFNEKKLPNSFSWLLSCFFILISLFSIKVNAQFNGPSPSPACANTPLNFSSSTLGNTFIYNYENNPSMNFSLSTLPSNSNVYSGNNLNSPTFTCTLTDNGSWYTFVGNSNTNTITRLDYGNSPLNVPILSNIGTFGTGWQLEGVSILKDNNGNWVGFAVNNTKLIRWEFSNNNLGNSPTNISTMDFPNYLLWPHQISIKKTDSTNGFIGFVANRNGTITRLDFGQSLLNPPLLTNLVSSSASACNFVLYRQYKSWYMITSNLLTHTISRMDFGSNIQNDTPTVTNLGNIGGLLNLPRGITLFPNCDTNQLFGYLLNENGNLIKFDFGGDITNTPIGSSLGSLGTPGFNDIGIFTFGQSIYSLSVNYANNSITRMNLFNVPTPFDVKYYTSPSSRIYSAGDYNASLYVDPGDPMGSYAYCKSFKVDNCPTNSIIPINTENSNLLSQNHPNPFRVNTIINYNLPINSKLAFIIVSDLSGKELLKFPIFSKNNSRLELTDKELKPGIYFYSMIIDGRKMDTKKMVIK